jgi:hypothetical protein
VTDTDQQPGPLAGYHVLPPWKGHRRWGCDHCPVDSLHEDRILAHVRAAHVGRAAAPVPSGLVAPDGTVLPSTLDDNPDQRTVNDLVEKLADARALESPGRADPPSSSRPWSARTHDDAHTPTDTTIDSPRIDQPWPLT